MAGHDEKSSDRETLTCPLCQGEMVSGTLKSPGFGNVVYVELPEEAQHYLVPKGKHAEGDRIARLDAHICLNCGHVLLHIRKSSSTGPTRRELDDGEW